LELSTVYLLRGVVDGRLLFGVCPVAAAGLKSVFAPTLGDKKIPN